MHHVHPIRCACGAFAGRLSPDAWTNRVICYCDDCQAFADRLGQAAAVLDPRGGSDIVQTGPRYVTFDQGREHLACLRLTPKGPLRWYTTCCNTPIGNTPASPGLSFVGLLHNCLGSAAELDAAFGPPAIHVFTGFARGEPKPTRRMPAGALAAMAWQLAWARIGGGYRTTPFFDGTGAPLVAPTACVPAAQPD